MNKIELYKRQSAFVELTGFCHSAKDGDFIEVTQWANAEGFDVCIDSSVSSVFQMTTGQFKALKKLVLAMNIADNISNSK